MSNEIAWPAKPFYIQSKMNLSNYALTVDGWVQLKPLQGTFDFLWTARTDPRGGAVLTHAKSGLVLSATGGHRSQLVVAPFDPSNPLQLFRLESLGGPWAGINALANWELKMNVAAADVNGWIILYAWSGGADNEEWHLIEEISEVETEWVHYDLDKATTNLDLPPTTTDSTIENNKLKIEPLTGSRMLSRTLTTSRSITNSTSDTAGQKFTQTFGVKGGVDKIFEVSASTSFEESKSTTISFSDTNQDSQSVTDQQVVNVNVPPGKSYAYEIVVHNGSCSIPYTAHHVFRSVVPGTPPYPFDSTGTYTGVNQIESEVIVKDVTEGMAQAVVVQRQSIA